MEFFRDTHIDFMKYRKYFVIVSLVLVVISILTVFVAGKLNLGVDFAGGTQVTVKGLQPQEWNDLRARRATAGRKFGWNRSAAISRSASADHRRAGRQRILRRSRMSCRASRMMESRSSEARIACAVCFGPAFPQDLPRENQLCAIFPVR